MKPEGDFVGTPKSRDDFKPTRGERAPVRKPQDNLKITGEFQDTTMQKSEFTVVRGERAEVKKHEDTLRVGSGTMECITTTKETFEKTPKKGGPVTPAGKTTTVNRRRHMESSISLGDDTTIMKTTNQTNYNTYTRKKVVEDKEVVNKQVIDKQVVDKRVIDKQVIDRKVLEDRRHVVQDKKQIDSDTKRVVERHVVLGPEQVQKTGKTTTDVTSDTKTLADGTIVTTTRHTTTTKSGVQKSQQNGAVVQDTQVQKHVTGGHDIRKSSSQTHVQESHQHVENRNIHNVQNVHKEHHVTNRNIVRENNIITNNENVTNQQVVRKDGHQRRSLMSSEADMNNQILYRKGLQTSTEALHTTSSAALDMKKSYCNLHEQGQYISNSSQSSDRKSLSSIHRTTQEMNNAGRRGQQWSSTQYQHIERPQKIVRKDNLTIGGNFYGQSEAKSYGNFTKQQNVQQVERVSRRSNTSHITLGDSNVSVVTSYKKEYLPRNIGPCPAALVNKPEGPFKHTRDTKTHKFYLPTVN